MIGVVSLAFVAAQGGAIFLTAFALAKLFRSGSWYAKIGLTAVSYAAWIIFTYVLFFSGADSYIVFFGLCTSALLSSVVYCAGWILAPLVMRPRHG